MSHPDAGRLDPRAWLLWGLAASLPPLLGRNPFVLVPTLLIALGVQAAWAASAPRAGSWRALVRLAAVFATVGALFNLLTAHIGDRVIGRLPTELPLIGGDLTLNAAVYGLLGGVALLALVVVGATLGATLDWPALRQVVPARLTTVAVAGSIAFAFIPQTVAAFHEIREAQAARGYRPRGPRDLVPLLVPLLTGGLERAVTLAEALESRAFGAAVADHPSTPRHAVATVVGLTAAVTGAYLLVVRETRVAAAVLVLAALALVVASMDQTDATARRTRYRSTRWATADTVVALSATLAVAVQLATLAVDPAAFRYEPYPSLTAPRVNLPLLAALALLLAPALYAPTAAEDDWDGAEAIA